MRKVSLSALVAAIMAIAVVAPASASAAVEVGDSCAGTTGTTENDTLVSLTSPSDPLPLTVPSAGVITRWKMMMNISGPAPSTIPQTLKVLRPVAGEEYEVVGESDGAVHNGENVFDVRIPVQAGDRLGVHGKPFEFGGVTQNAALLCEIGAEPATLGVYKGDATLGSVHTFASGPPGRLPITATVEPDVDGDGYGDETQDLCPALASTHGPCPVPPPPPTPLTLDDVPIAHRKFVQVFVATGLPATVTVTGVVRLPRAAGKKAHAGKSKAAKRLVQLKSKSVTVTPGQIGRLRVPLTKQLTRALRSLPRQRSLKLQLTTSGTAARGQTASEGATVKLRGEAPRHARGPRANRRAHHRR